MSDQTETYVACIRNDGVLDLEIGKLYLVSPPEPGDRDDDLRVVDDSGEDYLYPSTWFVAVEVPLESAQKLRAARDPRSSTAG